MSDYTNDVEFQRAIQENQARRLRFMETANRERADIIRDLGALGWPCDRLNDITKYLPLSERVIDCLLQWVTRTSVDNLRESLIHILACTRQRFPGGVLVNAYKSTDHIGVQFGVLRAIASCDLTGIDDFIDLTILPSEHLRNQLKGLGYRFRKK